MFLISTIYVLFYQYVSLASEIHAELCSLISTIYVLFFYQYVSLTSEIHAELCSLISTIYVLFFYQYVSLASEIHAELCSFISTIYVLFLPVCFTCCRNSCGTMFLNFYNICPFFYQYVSLASEIHAELCSSFLPYMSFFLPVCFTCFRNSCGTMFLHFYHICPFFLPVCFTCFRNSCGTMFLHFYHICPFFTSMFHLLQNFTLGTIKMFTSSDYSCLSLKYNCE